MSSWAKAALRQSRRVLDVIGKDLTHGMRATGIN
jgi:hypothetical protein